MAPQRAGTGRASRGGVSVIPRMSREDFNQYERRLRRQRYGVLFVPLGVIAAGLLVWYFGFQRLAGRAPDEELSHRLAASWACHAATRAGDPLSQEEMRSLVDRLFATSRPHGDPHGRVTFVRLELDELHRRFGRA